MGREDEHSPFNNIPTEDEIKSFDPKNGPSCTANDFKLDLEGFPRSPWNKSAAVVFARDFLAKYRAYECDESEIRDMWLRHTEHLRETYRKHRQAQEITERARRDARRRTRKDGVCRPHWVSMLLM